MSRLALVALLAVLASAAPAAAATGDALSYRLTLAPREATFGEPVTQTVDVVVDPDAIAPSSVRVHVDTRPYRVLRRTRTVLRAGALARIRFRYDLECLTQRCLPGGPERVFRFAPVRITYPAGTQIVYWPPLRIASLVDPRELKAPSIRSELVRQPQPTWRISPRRLEALLVGGALLLLAYPLLLAGKLALRGWRALRTTRLERLSPLERALELLRASAGNEHGMRRRALERLARELRGHELAVEARRLAWSRPRPEDDELHRIRDSVEAELERHG